MLLKNLFSVKCRIEIHGAGPALENEAVAGGMEAGSVPASRTQPLGVAPERGSRSRCELAPAAAAPLTEPAN